MKVPDYPCALVLSRSNGGCYIENLFSFSSLFRLVKVCGYVYSRLRVCRPVTTCCLHGLTKKSRIWVLKFPNHHCHQSFSEEEAFVQGAGIGEVISSAQIAATFLSVFFFLESFVLTWTNILPSFSEIWTRAKGQASGCLCECTVTN